MERHWQGMSVALLATALALLGCKERDPLFCDNVTRFCTDPTRPVCNLEKAECEPDGGTITDMGGGDMHLNCSTSAMCDDTAPICASGMCRACTRASDDAECAAHNASTPRCDSTSGKCVACTPATQASDCSTVTPICDTNGACRKCAAHSECPSGVCIFDGASAGSCASSSQIAYVDNKAMTPSTCALTGTHDGSSPATAFCDIQNGVDSARPFVLVAGHAGKPYGKVAITTSKTVTVIGPGQGGAQPASIYDATNVGVAITLSGAGTTGALTLDGLEIGDRTNPTTQDGISCNAAAGAAITLIVRRSAIQHSGKVGVNATGCDVTMDADVVANNTGGGLLLQSSDFTVENTIVALNGSASSTFGGIQPNGPGPANRQLIINSTVVENTAKNMAGIYSALDCVAAAAPIIFNVVANSNSNSQINPACTLDHSAFAGGTGTNTNLTNCTDANLFVDPANFDFHPRTAAVAPCPTTLLGKGSTSFMSVAAPDHDFGGSVRPQPTGSMPDVGAIEVP